MARGNRDIPPILSSALPWGDRSGPSSASGRTACCHPGPVATGPRHPSLLKEAYGERSDIYEQMADVITGQPADVDQDIERFGEWFERFRVLFEHLAPIRLYIPNEDDPTDEDA